MTNTKGLQFYKVDLHVHSPASEDFKDRGATAANIVDAALAKGLSAIAITDHQTGAWIDEVKTAAKGKNISIFPGVEIKVHGGKTGIHLVALFDTDKDSKHVDAFLNTLKAYERDGKPSVITNKTTIDVARALQEYDPTAILVLAHCLSGQGVISDMRGEQRNELFLPELTCLIGAESREEDFLDAKKIKDHDRIVDLFDGGFETFHYKRMGVYQASDAHSLSEIGSRYTYFKTDDQISIEDIRQCLIDRATRIHQSFEHQETAYPFIETVSITSGFLKDQTIVLHQGLNSLLGAKGAGKSLVIEFLRFVLNQPPKNVDVLRDHSSKIEKCLKAYGSVSVVVSDNTGKRYKITRTYKPSEGSPTEIVDLSDNSVKILDIEKLFPVLFLSQNEIVKIAEDESNQSQRQFIDRFFDFHKYQDEIESQNKQLSEIDSKVSDSIRAYISSSSLQIKISTYNEEIEKLGKEITNKVFEKYSNQEKIGLAINSQLEYLSSLEESLEVTLSEYIDLTAPLSGDEGIDVEPSVIRSTDATKAVIKVIPENIRNSLKTLTENKLKIQQEYDDWKSSFEEVKTEYENIVSKTGGNQVLLDQKRKTLLGEVARLDRTLAMDTRRSALLTERLEQRKKVVTRLEKAYKDYFEERQQRCSLFTKSSGGALHVSIKEAEDTSAFYTNIQGLKKGSWLKDEMIKTVTASTSPKDFINLIIEFELSGRKDKREIEKQSKKINVLPEELEKLIQHLLDNNTYEELLSLLYNSVPEDIPTISYKVDGTQKPLDELSVGQKAITLLIIALSDGNFPIVIDQPEDSLDLRTIWEDVCQKLRGAKESRQFIFTTHNSSVAVASDSDMFVILQATAKSGKVLYSGSINKSDIKKEVIDYLEGGINTYTQKRKKYNI